MDGSKPSQYMGRKPRKNDNVKFFSGDFSLKNAQRSGRQVEVTETHIKAIMISDRHSTTQQTEMQFKKSCQNWKSCFGA